MTFMLNLGIDGKEAVKIEKKGVPQMRGTPLYVNISVVLFLALLAWSPGLQLLEEVVALVIDEDERREVLHADLPDGFHSEVWIFNALDALDALVGEDSRRAADRAEVESTVLLAGIGDDLGTVALGDHDHTAAVILEEINVRVHTVGRGRSH